MRVDISVLAGGSSSRMGRDKASIEWNGQTVLERIVSAARSTGRNTFVVGREKPDKWNIDSVDFYRDDRIGEGPLAGLSKALSITTADAVLALACDTPLLTRTSIDWLLRVTEQLYLSEDGVAVRNSGRLDPLFSIYAKSCQPRIELMLTSGNRALYKLIQSAKFLTIDAPAEVSSELINFNSPEDWLALTNGAARIGCPCR
jgi:molybdopterin-guanine dinucleotide biosynthesis protein A